MENARGILVLFLLTAFLQNSKGQDLMDEILFQHNSCYGSNRDYSIVNANCSAGNVIAISRVQAGVKLNNSSCPIVLDDNTTVDFENCCKIVADDCVVNVSTTNWHVLCSGNESCVTAPAVSVASNCTPMFRANTSNMQLDYYCINITRIGSTCTQVTMTTFENALYLWNAGYSSGANAGTDCVCSIQVESCDAHIEVTAMRIDLEDDNGTCIQNITFSDSLGNPEMVIDCSKQYDITPLFTSTTNYLSMNFISDINNTLGKYWIRFKATEAKSDLHVDCTPAKKQASCRTTSTKTNSSTTITTTITQKTTTTKTRTPPTTAASTITALKNSTAPRKTDTRPQENLEYIALIALVPIVPLIIYILRKRKPVKVLQTPIQFIKIIIPKPATDVNYTYATPRTRTTYTSTTITVTTSNATITAVTSTSPSSPTFVSAKYVNSSPKVPSTTTPFTSTTITMTTSTTTTTVAISRSPSPPIFLSATYVNSSPKVPSTTTPFTSTTINMTTSTKTTTVAISRSPSPPIVVSVLTSDQPPLCACSYCGRPGKHYHPIASSARKYSKKKHFRCRYCGIFWDKITNLPVYSPCPYISNKY